MCDELLATRPLTLHPSKMLVHAEPLRLCKGRREKRARTCLRLREDSYCLLLLLRCIEPTGLTK